MYVSIEDFKIIEKLGEGAYGVVFLAIYKANGEKVALKRLKKEGCDPKVINRFKREAYILKKVVHPSTARFYGAFETESSLFIAMEYIEGKLLSTILDECLCNTNCGYLSENIAMRYFLEIACILRYLHKEAKVVHRDIKMDNIIVDSLGHVHLVDFGFANSYGYEICSDSEDSDCVGSPLFDTICGTVGYMAPELIQRGHYSDKVDIWSIGVILYKIVTGKLPFFHENLQAACKMIVTEDPIFPPELSHEMVELISKLLIKSPAERPSIDEVFQIPIVLRTAGEYFTIVNNLTNPPSQKISTNQNTSNNDNLCCMNIFSVTKKDFTCQIANLIHSKEEMGYSPNPRGVSISHSAQLKINIHNRKARIRRIPSLRTNLIGSQPIPSTILVLPTPTVNKPISNQNAKVFLPQIRRCSI
ncbi:AGC family protein kinase [Tritrichomonas foetus]|uniref:AGC family protein kinase n=1 Tax=Tritrichomonas foetus TaxID=1144522 RepID=A0A1J4KDL7_9EUKA|nr:AGC family protein kinase [Tritrichomonas foetus]|eukprot:OHT07726.1 AGC family protein kinase [Tritrichomonas foetus]